jgi:hypothetical protein
MVGLTTGSCIVAAVLIHAFYREQLAVVRQEQGRA